MNSEILIELTKSEADLVEAARTEMAKGSIWAPELSRSIASLDHTRRLSTADFKFALSVLRATVADAKSIQRGN